MKPKKDGDFHGLCGYVMLVSGRVTGWWQLKYFLFSSSLFGGNDPTSLPLAGKCCYVFFIANMGFMQRIIKAFF